MSPSKAWSRYRRVLVGLMMAWTWLGQVPRALALPPSRPEQHAREEASRHFDKGMREAKAGLWEAARRSFALAWAAQKHYQIAANLGRAELMVRRYRDAAEHLHYSLRAAGRMSAGDRKKIEGMLAEARANIGTVTVKVAMDGADVEMNGTHLGHSPLPDPIFVEPGKHTFEAKMQGFLPVTQSLVIHRGGATVVALRPVPVPQPVKVKRATSPGPPEQNHPDPVLIWTGVGLSAVALGAGVGTAIVSDQKAWESNMLLQKCALPPDRCRQTFEKLQNEKALLGNVSFWSFIGAGATGVAVAVYHAWATWPPQRQPVSRTRISVGPAGGWVTIEGDF